MEYFFSAIIGFLLGSIPTGYLILKRSKGIDITNTGSGNVGAMNSYEITNSKKIGLLVLLIDFLKGSISAILPKILFEDIFILPALALLLAIFSHCFNPWINFKGGRGLATAAGGTFFLFPFLLVVWITLWILTYIIKKDILFANIFATVFSIIAILITNGFSIKYAYPTPATPGELVLLSTSGLLIIFIKHIEPLKEFLSKK